MGEERNLELVRRWLDQPKGREDDARALLIDELFDELCDFYPVRAVAENAPCHGRAEIHAYLREFWPAWETWDISLRRLEAIEGDRALAQTHIRAVGKESGVELDAQLFHCFWFRNGRILRLEDHTTERGAREGLGLDG